MVIQSRPLRLLMTRPLPQSHRFARDLRIGMHRPLRITHAPLIQPVFLQSTVPDRQFHAVIFTSETGVAAAQHMPNLPKLAFCVGDQTAKAARNAGFAAHSAEGDADALIATLRNVPLAGRLLHICGEDTRGDVAVRLNSAGIETETLIAYRQMPAALTPAARKLLAGEAPVIVPLFSPRTAMIFAQQAEPVWHARLYITAFSPAVAQALGSLPVAGLEAASHPTADAMIAAVGRIADKFPVA